VLLAMLLLRGPQTLGELVSRSERLHRFADADEARHAIERLQQRAAGGAAAPAASARTATCTCCAVKWMARRWRRIRQRGGGSEAADPGLAERVAQLEAAVAELQAQLAELRG
jgi:uncharacterized protein YceH (UPF0502 family)